MKKIILFFAILTFIIAIPLCAEAVGITPVEDTYVQSGSSASVNFGSNINMLVKSGETW